MRIFGLACGLLLAVSVLGGCSRARFSEASPSVRSFHDNGGVGDTYVGFDLGFVLENDDPHVPGLPRVVER